MNIWIINPYGELPTGEWREYRSYMLAKELARNGHEVTWWISNFDHRAKKYRDNKSDELIIEPGLKCISVPSTAYYKNISIRRILYEINFGKNLIKMSKFQIKPDLIVLGYPAIFTGGPIFQLKRELSIPLILDVIDLWPELFEVALPNFLKPFSRFIFSPLYRIRKNQVNSSDGVVAVSCNYRDVAMNEATVKIKSEVVYLGLEMSTKNDSLLDGLINDQVSLFRDKFSIIAVYAGTLGDAYDMDLLLDAANFVKESDLSVGFIVAGNGPRYKDFESKGGSIDNLLFLGLLPAKQLASLYSYCDVGLMTYVPGSTVAMPVKLFDYLAAGLAILNCLGRDVGDITVLEGVGLNYKASNINDFIEKLQVFSDDRGLLNSCKAASKNIAQKYEVNSQYSLFRSFIESYER